MSLALATLLYEWKRYSAARAALAFSGLLVLAQVGMFSGIVHGITATIDRSRADILVLGPKNESLINSGPNGLPARIPGSPGQATTVAITTENYQKFVAR